MALPHYEGVDPITGLALQAQSLYYNIFNNQPTITRTVFMEIVNELLKIIYLYPYGTPLAIYEIAFGVQYMEIPIMEVTV